jgi:hypothetical protein
LRDLLSCLTLLTASCHSADVSDRDASPPPTRTQTAEIRKGWWRACQSDADCQGDHVCIAVDTRPEQAMWLAPFLEPKACALVMPPNLALHDDRELELRYRERLVLFRKVRLTLTRSMCTAAACYFLNGAPVDCCNRCDGEHVWLSGFAGVSIIGPDGERLECKDHMDCEPQSCPPWVQLDKDFEIAGAFHTVEEHLAFVLATDPEHWSDPY